MKESVVYKTCTGCSEVKGEEHFMHNRASYCKACFRHQHQSNNYHLYFEEGGETIHNTHTVKDLELGAARHRLDDLLFERQLSQELGL